jgi:hypothetical protein
MLYIGSCHGSLCRRLDHSRERLDQAVPASLSLSDCRVVLASSHYTVLAREPQAH